MKATGSDSCGFAELLAIFKVKSLKFDVKTLEIVRFSPKQADADKRNTAAPKETGYGSQRALPKEGVRRVLKSF